MKNITGGKTKRKLMKAMMKITLTTTTPTPTPTPTPIPTIPRTNGIIGFLLNLNHSPPTFPRTTVPPNHPNNYASLLAKFSVSLSPSRFNPTPPRPTRRFEVLVLVLSSLCSVGFLRKCPERKETENFDLSLLLLIWVLLFLETLIA